MAVSNIIQYPKKNIQYNDEIIEKLKNSLDIKEVIEKYERQTFKNNKMLCPFHDEKTGSLAVDEKEQLFKCFGCDVAGDVIRYVELKFNLSFKEAVEKLAKDFNIDLGIYSPQELKVIEKQHKAKQVIQNIYNSSLEYFQKQLNDGHISYLNDRYGLTPSTIKQARIGYCKGDLLGYLRSKEFADKDIYNSGLVTKKEGKLKDMYYKRIMIPYIEHNQIKYFTGRSLKSNDTLKYLNLKHTSEYIVNPLFIAKVEGNDKLILTEGELDSLAATELLSNYDVIALGKAGLSKYKKDKLFKLIKKYKDVIIINDTDKNKAGINGAIDTSKAILKGTGNTCKIGKLETLEGQSSTDIADYNKNNKELYPVIEQAIDFIELLIKDIENLSNGREAINKTKKLYPILALMEEDYQGFYIELIRESISNIKGCSKSTLNKSTIQEGIDKAKSQAEEFEGHQKPWFEINDNGNVKFRPAILAKYLLEMNNYINLSDNIYQYKDGVFVDGGETDINKLLMNENILADEWEVKRADSVVSYIKRATKENPIKVFQNSKYDNLVNVKNGMVNLESAIFNDDGKLKLNDIELSEHNPKYKSFTQLNVKFNPDVECRKVDEVINSILLDKENPDYNKVKVFWEFIGWIIFNGELELKKALLMVGDGDNGKTVLLNYLTELLGRKNIGVVGLYDLIINQYAASDLFGKIANLAGEMSNNILKDIEMFKKLTGNDLIRADQKYKEPIKFKNKAKLIFALNSLPKVVDYEEAFFNRLIIIRTPNTFTKDNFNYDPHILNKITTEEALSYGLNKAIEGFARLVCNEFSFTESDEINEELIKYQADVNTAIPFINEICNFKPGEITSKSKLYDIYKDWAYKNGFGQMSKKKLTIRINQGFNQLETKKARFGNSTDWAWKGLQIKPEFNR